MTFSETFGLALGTSQTGLTLKAALVGTDGVIDTTKRDITAGFTESGSGNYQWVYASFADGFRGSVVFYTGSLGVAADFTGVAVKASAAAGLVPTEIASAGATATRTELATELARIDVATSTRSSHSANDVRDSVLSRVLSGNYEVAGTVGKILQTILSKTNLLGSGNVTVGAPVADDGSIPIIYQGDDYAGSRKLTFTFNSSGFSITGASSRFEAEPTEGSSFAATGSMTDNGDGTATASIAITSAQSALLETGPVKWSALNITSAGLRETVAEGSSPLARRKHV